MGSVPVAWQIGTTVSKPRFSTMMHVITMMPTAIASNTSLEYVVAYTDTTHHAINTPMGWGSVKLHTGTIVANMAHVVARGCTR